MNRSLLGLSLGALMFASSNACGPSVLLVLDPYEGEVLTWMPVTIDIDMTPDVELGTFVVTLNGVDVTSEFVMGSVGGRPRATATRIWEEGLVLEGANQIVASVQYGEGEPTTMVRNFTTEGDPHADGVALFVPGTNAGFGQAELPGVVLGPPRGGTPTVGSLDVLSLGLGGVVQLEFIDNVIVDGPGPDFTVFENAFFVRSGLTIVSVFSEPGRVSVSEDGVSWCSFDTCLLDQGEGPFHPGCAGVYPVVSDADTAGSVHPSIPTEVPVEDWMNTSILTLDIPGAGGDAFDLADLDGCSASYVRYVEIESAGFLDGPAGPDNQGFDLDAITASNAVPSRDDDSNGVPDSLE